MASAPVTYSRQSLLWIQSRTCSSYLIIFYLSLFRKAQIAVVTTVTYTTHYATIYTKAETTIAYTTSSVLTTVATALETIPTSTTTEIITTSTETESQTAFTVAETLTASTETDSTIVSTDFVTVYTPTVTEIVTISSVSHVPKVRVRDLQPPDCWTAQYPPSRLRSVCCCIKGKPAPTKTVYTTTRTVTNTISKTLEVGALSIIKDTILFTKSVKEVTTVPVTVASIVDVDVTTVLGAVATTVIPVTVTSIADITITSVVDIVETSTLDVTKTVTSSTTTITTVSCTDPVINGGFDTGSIAPWQVRGQGESYTFVSPGHDSSAFALQITFTGSTGGVFVMDQSAVVCTGVTYDFSIWINNVSTNPDSEFSLVMVEVFLSGSYFSSTGGTATIIGPGWQQVTGSFDAASPGIGIEISVEFEPNTNGDVGVILVDDFVITAT